MNLRNCLPAVVLLAAVFACNAASADPLHAIENDAYWHHDSNFIFPAKLADFTRVGAPQELDGSTTVKAYYAKGSGDARVVVEIWLSDGGTVDDARYSVVRNGWSLAVRAPMFTDYAVFEAVVQALPVDRLGMLDTRCPNPGCGS